MIKIHEKTKWKAHLLVGKVWYHLMSPVMSPSPAASSPEPRYKDFPFIIRWAEPSMSRLGQTLRETQRTHDWPVRALPSTPPFCHIMLEGLSPWADTQGWKQWGQQQPASLTLSAHRALGPLGCLHPFLKVWPERASENQATTEDRAELS